MKRGCLLRAALVLVAGVVAVYASGRVWSEVVEGVAYVHHDDAWWNCCPDTVFEIKRDGFDIDIYEHDLGTNPCLCGCYFDFTHALAGLEPGTYVARVWEIWKQGEPELAGTTTFSILELIGSPDNETSMSECHEEPGVEDDADDAADDLELSGFPPARNSVAIRYVLPQAASVDLIIYDVVGNRVRTLNEGNQEEGEHLLVWDARNDAGRAVPSGIYFVRLEAAGEVRSLPLVVLR